MMKAYLDNNATTRPFPEVVEAMRPYWTDLYVNPSSVVGRMMGIDCAIDNAKRALGQLLGGVDLANCVHLTSGASEANSWALAGALEGCARAHIVVSAIEHPSLLAACDAARRAGHAVTPVTVTHEGVVDCVAFEAALEPETRIVSVMLANNETGAIQPLARLASILRAKAPQAILHCDATQAVGRVPVDLLEVLSEVDLLSLSAHKFHGPMGVGALFIRPGVTIAPLIHGGQERGLRGGTLNAGAAAGLAAACRIARERISEWPRQQARRDNFERALRQVIPAVSINAANASRLPNTSSITIPGLDAADLVDALALQGICIAMGSACSAGSDAPSHVLTAMGLSQAQARSTIRISISQETTQAELDTALSAIVAAAGGSHGNRDEVEARTPYVYP